MVTSLHSSRFLSFFRRHHDCPVHECLKKERKRLLRRLHGNQSAFCVHYTLRMFTKVLKTLRKPPLSRSFEFFPFKKVSELFNTHDTCKKIKVPVHFPLQNLLKDQMCCHTHVTLLFPSDFVDPHQVEGADKIWNGLILSQRRSSVHKLIDYNPMLVCRMLLKPMPTLSLELTCKPPIQHSPIKHLI